MILIFQSVKKKKKKPRYKCTGPSILEGVMESVTLKTLTVVSEISTVAYKYVRWNSFQ